jgi:hypothetical protein
LVVLKGAPKINGKITKKKRKINKKNPRTIKINVKKTINKKINEDFYKLRY